VNKVRAAETAAGLGNKLSTSVAKYYFKLMAYKDEYEVARLYTDGRFVEQLKAQFEGDFSVKFNLAPPLLAKKDAKGHLVKAEFGSWMWSAFKLLAKMKGLRGGAFDIFGYTEERKMERALIVEYRSMVEALAAGLTIGNHATAVELANLPEQVRGFGHVKEKWQWRQSPPAVAKKRDCWVSLPKNTPLDVNVVNVNVIYRTRTQGST
jgi:indolepyruvate ferredoxin oxidoreductase